MTPALAPRVPERVPKLEVRQAKKTNGGRSRLLELGVKRPTVLGASEHVHRIELGHKTGHKHPHGPLVREYKEIYMSVGAWDVI